MFNPVTETIMTKVQLKNLAPAVIRADEAAYYGLKSIADYKSSNPEFSLEAATAAHEECLHQEEAETVAYNTYKAIRDARAIAENKRHDVMNGCKTQVRATYGEDSDELASMGLKKKSEKKTGGGRGKKEKDAG